MWKGRPTIGGNVGGIPLQIEDGVSGFLVDSPEEAAQRSIEILEDPELAKRLGRHGKEHAREHFLTPRLLRDWLDLFTELETVSPGYTGGMAEQRLVIVSNRGPAQFERGPDGERIVQRGGGGLVTALTGPGRPPRGALDRLGDDRRGRRGRPRGRRATRSRSSSTGSPTTCCMVESDADAYDRFYNVIANPILWFIQHYLWDLSNAPGHPPGGGRRVGARLQGRQRATSPRRSCETIEGEPEPLVMFHDYHLYTAPGARPRGAPGRVPPALRPHPLVAARQLADPARAHGARRSTAACSPTTSSASTPPPTAATSCTAAAS